MQRLKWTTIWSCEDHDHGSDDHDGSDDHGTMMMVLITIDHGSECVTNIF